MVYKIKSIYLNATDIENFCVRILGHPVFKFVKSLYFG